MGIQLCGENYCERMLINSWNRTEGSGQDSRLRTHRLITLILYRSFNYFTESWSEQNFVESYGAL